MISLVRQTRRDRMRSKEKQKEMSELRWQKIVYCRRFIVVVVLLCFSVKRYLRYYAFRSCEIVCMRSHLNCCWLEYWLILLLYMNRSAKFKGMYIILFFSFFNLLLLQLSVSVLYQKQKYSGWMMWWCMCMRCKKFIREEKKWSEWMGKEIEAEITKRTSQKYIKVKRADCIRSIFSLTFHLPTTSIHYRFTAFRCVLSLLLRHKCISSFLRISK